MAGPSALDLVASALQGRRQKDGDVALVREIARLQAAHDALLAALRHLLAVDVASEAGRYRDDRTQAQVAARAAIAKAEG